MKLKLYHYWRSSSSWRVRWCLEYKKIPCEFVPINLLSEEPESPEHLKRNPLGYVPVFEISEGNSPFRYLGESMAMIEWLDEVYPTPSLLPGTPLERARIRQLAELINSGTQPLQNLNAIHRHSNQPDEQRKWSRFWIENGLHAYETLVKETAGKFSFGDQLTLADLYLIPQCYNAARNEVSMDPYPLIQRIQKNGLATESCQASAPDRFKPET